MAISHSIRSVTPLVEAKESSSSNIDAANSANESDVLTGRIETLVTLNDFLQNCMGTTSTEALGEAPNISTYVTSIALWQAAVDSGGRDSHTTSNLDLKYFGPPENGFDYEVVSRNDNSNTAVDVPVSGPPGLRAITNTGDSANRVDVIFLGDGYTSSQVGTTFTTHIQNYLSYIFDDSALTQPFGRYDKFFNVWAVDVVSNQSGADDPGTGTFRDTALDASYYWDGITERLLYVSDIKAQAAMNSALEGTSIGAEMRYVLVNDSKYGGGGGYFGVYSAGNSSAREIALHEIGHSFAGLADEYGGNTETYTGAEPSEINVTKNPSGAKWAEWLGFNDPVLGVVGAYDGGRYFDHGIYRPTDNSKMRSLDRPFDPIAREEFIHRFYQLLDPLDGHDDNVGTKINAQTLSVDVIDPSVIQVDWTVNGQTFINSGETFNFSDHGFGIGSYTVTARAYDPTDWVRGDRSDLEEAVTWTVIIQAFNSPTVWGTGVRPQDKIGDFNGDGKADVIQLHENGNQYVWISNGSGFNSYTVWGKGSRPSDKIGDFNGDGKDDVIQLHENGTAYVWLSNGNGFQNYTVWGTGVRPQDQIGDFNGDGKDDVIQLHENGTAYVWLSNGNGFQNYTVWGSGVRPQDKIGDFNGDGKDDVIQLHENGNAYVWTSNAAAAANDVFAFGADFGNDIITDFEAGEGAGDVIEFDQNVFAEFSDVLAHTADDGYGNTIISHENGDTIILLNVLKINLAANDFHFV